LGSIISPYYNVPLEELEYFFYENNFQLKFSFKHKIYYNFLRKIIPISLRHKIQNKYCSNLSFKKNFIYDDLVNIVTNSWDRNDYLFYPQNYSSSIILTHDVEEQSGFDFIPNVIELEEKYLLRSSWNIVPYKYKIDRGIISLIQDLDHEIGIHGFNHDGKLYYSEKIFNERAKYINDAIRKYKAVGFRSPQAHRNLNWLQKLDIQYDSSCFDYDPFQPFPGGTGTIWPFVAGKFIELPYTLPQDHTLFYVLKIKDIDIWLNKINWIIKNHGMVLLITHPDYLIKKNNLAKYEELLKYIIQLKNVWHCLPKQMALWYLHRKTFKDERFKVYPQDQILTR